jgi:peptidyl-prolyl cis-trans isomerase A (cyclophilin A)
VFVNLVNKNYRLDEQGFAPFGKVIQGMDVVESLYTGYGDSPPGGAGPRQDLLRRWGNAYLDRDFPKLDRITEARILK